LGDLVKFPARASDTSKEREGDTPPSEGSTVWGVVLSGVPIILEAIYTDASSKEFDTNDSIRWFRDCKRAIDFAVRRVSRISECVGILSEVPLSGEEIRELGSPTLENLEEVLLKRGDP
jgi:hypothetical protein